MRHLKVCCANLHGTAFVVTVAAQLCYCSVAVADAAALAAVVAAASSNYNNKCNQIKFVYYRSINTTSSPRRVLRVCLVRGMS